MTEPAPTVGVATGPVEELAAAPPRRRSPLVVAARLLATVLAVAALLWLVPREELARAFRQVPAAVWVTALAAYLAMHLIGVAKWRGLMRAAGAELSFPAATRCYYAGLFGNFFLPSIMGGDLVRATLALRLAKPKSGVLLGSLVDRFLDVIGLATLAAGAALFVPATLDPRSRTLVLSAGALVALGVVSLVVVLWWASRGRLPTVLDRRLAGVRQALAALRDRPGAIAKAFVTGVVLQTLQVALNAALARALAVAVPFSVWLFAWPLAKISALLPLTQGGIGVREAAQTALLAPFGVRMVDAVAVGFAFQAVVVAGGLVAGVISLALARSH